MANADGSVIFSCDLDSTKAQKKLSKLRDEISELNSKLEKETGNKMNLEKQLDAAAESMLSYKRSDFARITSELRTLNPMSVISRGYSAVFDGGGALVKSIEQLNEGDRFTFRASDGEIDGIV